MKLNFPIIAAFVMLIVFLSCDKEPNPVNNFPDVKQGEGVFILNEGNFQWGNSSVSFYNKSNGSTWHDIFKAVNGEGPGDILNSAILHNDLIWLVVNNSGKIEAMDPKNGQRKATISGFTSPRFMVASGANKAYVSDLFAGGVHVVDLHSNTITGKIGINGWTEAILNTGTKVIVSAMGSGKIFAIDTATDQLTDSLEVGPGPNSIVMDHEGMLWILCGGDYMSTAGSILARVDPQGWQILEVMELPQTSMPYSRLNICHEGKKLYFIGADIYLYDTENTASQVQTLIPGEGIMIYGLGVDPTNGEIYVSDAIDFTQQGMVMRYTPQGQKLDEFFARIIPGGFLFY